MKKYLTTPEAAILAETLRKIAQAAGKSPVILAALDIDRHDLAKCMAVLKRCEK